MERLCKLAKELEDKVRGDLVGRKIVSVEFGLLFKDMTDPERYHVAFHMALDDGAVINAAAWPPYIQVGNPPKS